MTRLVPASKFVGMCALNSCIERFIFVAKSYVLLGKTKKPKTGIFLSYFSLLLFFPVDMFLSHTHTHARTHARTYTNTHKHTHVHAHVQVLLFQRIHLHRHTITTSFFGDFFLFTVSVWSKF